MEDVLFCPFCGSNNIEYIGRQGEREIRRCRDCEIYFIVEELEPPFDATIER